ncbi:hypothetical protein ABT282_08055 [Streptomyces sp. NPDC000927]|uniref:hypothetical protein n=1 Tax=Streptomyces sp. NPDC000927 TaxID=3154371 RepID=UPI00332201CD
MQNVMRDATMDAMRASRVSVTPTGRINDTIERIQDPHHYANYRQAVEELTGSQAADKNAALLVQILTAGVKAIEGRAQEIWYEQNPDDIQRRARREDFYADLPYEVQHG